MVEINNEHDLQTLIIDYITQEGGHASNVESGRTAAGIPDVDYHLDVTNNLEIKHITKKRTSHIRPTQVKWFRDRIKAGGEPLLLAYLETEYDTIGTLALYHGSTVDKLVSLKYPNQWLQAPGVFWVGINIKDCWRDILSLLKNPDLVLHD